MLKLTIYKASFLVFLLVIIGFSSCIINHIGNAGQNIPPLGTNYKILTVAKGQATSTRFLGLETRDRKALTSEAMQNMILQYPLSNGQTYGFLNVDSRNESFFLFNKTIVTVTSFLIEAADSMTNDREFIELVNSQNKNLNYRFPVGSRVYFVENERIVEGFIKQFDAFGQAYVVYVSSSGKKEQAISSDKLFPTAASSDAFLKRKGKLKISTMQDSILRLEEKIFLENKMKEQDPKIQNRSFEIGDKVYFNSIKGKTLGEITKIEGDNISVIYEEKKGVRKTVILNRLKVVLATE